MTDPLKHIEDQKGQQDIGVMFVRVFQGAHEESGSVWAAFWTTAACFVASLKQSDADAPDDEATQ